MFATRFPFALGVALCALPAVALDVSAVRGGLLESLAAEYYQAWRGIVNPTGAELAAVYGAMGPDVTTVLLATDATDMVGVDRIAPDLGKLQDALAAWDWLEVDGVLPVEGRSPRAWVVSKAIRYRSEHGYWQGGDVQAFGIARLVMIELHRHGVTREEILLDTDATGAARIRFPWAYPGEAKKLRTLRYVRGDLPKDLSPRLNEIRFIPKVYLQKAGLALQVSAEMMESVSELVGPGGWVLWGAEMSDARFGEVNERQALRRFPATLQPTLSPWHLEEKIHRRDMDRSLCAHRMWADYFYGWKLMGLRRVSIPALPALAPVAPGIAADQMSF